MKFKNFRDLKTQLEEKFDGICTVSMSALRDAYGADRLGVNVVANMSAELDGLGVAHMPSTLPKDQYQLARVYLRNSPVGKLIDASTRIDSQADATLRKAINERAEDVLKRVKEIVCG